MITIRAICNWYSFQEQYKLVDDIRRQFVFDDNFTSEIKFTLGENYDFLLIFNSFDPNLISIKNKKNTIGFILEPPAIWFGYDKELGKHCEMVFTTANKNYYENNDNFITASSFMFYHLKGKGDFYRFNNNFQKEKKLSFVVSGKTGNPMYEFRRKLLEKILESDLECDIFGRGLNIDDKRFKGSPDDKADALIPYEFSIVIENSIYDSYVSEKMFDCFLCNTIPIYYGSHTAETLYVPDSFYRLPYTNDLDKLIQWLKKITTESHVKEKMKKSLLISKERYFTNFNLYNLIKKTVNEKK